MNLLRVCYCIAPISHAGMLTPSSAAFCMALQRACLAPKHATCAARAPLQCRLQCCAVQRLASLADATLQRVWWPFTQHQGMTRRQVTVIEARVGESFLVAEDAALSGAGSHAPDLVPKHDACSSWWTQVPCRMSCYGPKMLAGYCSIAQHQWNLWHALQSWKSLECWLLWFGD